MRTEIQRSGFLHGQLGPLSSPRLILPAGSRQAGKTTLACEIYSDLDYLNLDAEEQRETLHAVRVDAWTGIVGPASSSTRRRRDDSSLLP